MFGEFEQRAKKLSGDEPLKYLLKARYITERYSSVNVIEGDDIIVTSMKRFYQSVHISYHDDFNDAEYEGSVFVGVSFRDQKGTTVESTK